MNIEGYNFSISSQIILKWSPLIINVVGAWELGFPFYFMIWSISYGIKLNFTSN